MSLTNITLEEKNTFFDNIKAYFLYQRAFPKEEKKPYWLIRKCQRLGYGRNFIIKDESGKFLGIAFIIFNKSLALLDYFAIDSKLRGQGVGTLALAKIKEQFSDIPLVLEIEDPELPSKNREDRIKRARFYEKCGMITMNYRISLFGVDMRILSSGANVSYEEYHNLLSEVLGEHFSRNVYLLK
jgi:GNAT superfamily N-acetyltransferase